MQRNLWARENIKTIIDLNVTIYNWYDFSKSLPKGKSFLLREIGQPLNSIYIQLLLKFQSVNIDNSQLLQWPTAIFFSTDYFLIHFQDPRKEFQLLLIPSAFEYHSLVFSVYSAHKILYKNFPLNVKRAP